MKTMYQLWETVAVWDTWVNAGSARPLALLKHSTACPISSAALQEFVIFSRKYRRRAEMAVVYVIESRGLSDRIAADTGVTHESPQFLLLAGKEVVWHASHWKVSFERMEQALQANS